MIKAGKKLREREELLNPPPWEARGTRKKKPVVPHPPLLRGEW
jgi:hypothetical protein